MDGQEIVNQEVFRRLDKLDKQYEKLDDKVGNLDVRMTSIETENKHQTKKIFLQKKTLSLSKRAFLHQLLIYFFPTINMREREIISFDLQFI